MAGPVAAIHQPNLAPRLSTLAKLYAADIWIVLDDVQANARDYQHRARLAEPGQPDKQRWLTIPTHRPDGRATQIRDVRIAQHDLARRRLTLLTAQLYRRVTGWPDVHQVVDATVSALDTTDLLAPVAETSTRALLTLLGWHGTIRHSSTIVTRTDRTCRLADLTAAVGATSYLCGTGGARYLGPEPFRDLGLIVTLFAPPTDSGCWTSATRLSSLHPLAEFGAAALTHGIRTASTR